MLVQNLFFQSYTHGFSLISFLNIHKMIVSFHSDFLITERTSIAYQKTSNQFFYECHFRVNSVKCRFMFPFQRALKTYRSIILIKFIQETNWIHLRISKRKLRIGTKTYWHLLKADILCAAALTLLFLQAEKRYSVYSISADT